MDFLKKFLKISSKYHYPLFIFLFFYFLYSFLIYKIVPITTDEQFRYQRGSELLSHYLNSGYLQTYITPDKEPDTYYFYVMLVNILNPKFYYEWFHLQNLLFSSIIFVAIYFIVYSYSNNKFFAVLGPLALFLTPSFSGHLGSNPIDMPFACLFLLNIYLIYRFRDRGFDFKKIIILGISFWLILGLRPVGYQIFFHYLVFSFLFNFKKPDFRSLVIGDIKNLILIFFVASFLSILSWPYLGLNYFKNLPGILFVNANYDKWDNLILFNGSYLSKSDRPWYYLLTYIFLTIPSYILFSFMGSFAKFRNNLKIGIFFVLFFNLVLYLVLKPVIYNGMRHFLYVIPLIVCLALFGIWDLYKSNLSLKLKKAVAGLGVLSILWTTYQIINLFPNHYAYFNEVSGGFSRNYTRFETEYWGGIYKYGSIYIRNNLSKSKPHELKIYSCNSGFSVDYYSEKKFLTTIKKTEADLIICDYVEDRRLMLKGKVIKEIKLGGVSYLFIRENEFKSK